MGWWQVSTTTYDYDGHAPCEVLHTWADGFGIWHVTLETEGMRATIPPAAEARDAIVAELADREPPSFDPSSIGAVSYTHLGGCIPAMSRARSGAPTVAAVSYTHLR